MYKKNDNKKSRPAKSYGKPAGRRPASAKDTARKGAYDEKSRSEEYNNGSVPGRNAVRELLKSGKDIEKIYVRKGDREGSITVLVAEALNRKIPVIEVEKEKLDSLCGYEQHQGIVAIASEKEYCTVEDILAIAEERGEKPLIVIADGVSDPHNLGAIIRCAEGAGAHGVIIPKRRSVGLNATVGKTSAGAIEYMPVARVTNIVKTMEMLKKEGLWFACADMGENDHFDTNMKGPIGLVIGSEGEGVSRLVKENCDFTASIPMYGKISSLNASVAAALLMYEVVRQRNYSK